MKNRKKTVNLNPATVSDFVKTPVTTAVTIHPSFPITALVMAVLTLGMILALAVNAPGKDTAMGKGTQRGNADSFENPYGRSIQINKAADPNTRAQPASTVVDTVLVYGGPGSLDGKFEDATALPDWQGWSSVDMTQPTTSAWHIDSYHCDNLDPTNDPNHAWWCGEYFAYDCSTGDYGGYGNDYLEYLDWYGTVADNSDTTIVILEALLNYDNEPGYDFLYFGHEANTGMVSHATYNGAEDSVTVSVNFTLGPDEYVGENNDQVHLRWWFTSDGGWSDEDCDWPTLGAAQIDLIRVFFDQGAGPVQIGMTESCEPGDPVQWEPEFRLGVGNFAQVWPLLDDIDPAVDNTTPQVAFIDDGIVVPGTGGTHCLTWCYGPSGYCVNVEGGLAGTEYQLHNEIWSPVIAWPGGDYHGGVFSFGVYRHETLQICSPGVWYVWHVRSTEDPTGETGWSNWLDRDFLYYGGPDYHRHDEDITDMLLPDCQHVQLALGAYQLSWIWAWCILDPTPAPYFDNVALRGYTADPSAPVVSDLFFQQIDWYRPDGTLAQADSFWGRLIFNYEPSDRTHYLNVSAVDSSLPPGNEFWLIQNFPLLPKEYPDESQRTQAVDFSLLGLISAAGQPCPDLLISTTVDMFPRTEPPPDPDTLVSVQSLDRYASDSIDEAPDPGPFTNAGVPSGIINYGAPTRFGRRHDLPEVQEGMNQSFAGSCARNLDWLNRKYDLNLAMSAQNIFDQLIAAGVSVPNPDGTVARDEWIARADSLARDLTGDKMVTSVWDRDNYVDPIAGIPENNVATFWDWLREQHEMGHAVQVAYYQPGLPQVVSIAAAYRAGVKYFLQYCDDEDQSDAVGEERGDLFPKDTNLYVHSEDHFFGRNGILIYYAVCLAPDCNQNGIGDGSDIATGTSPDENDNGIPDECELVAVEDEPYRLPHQTPHLTVAPNPFNPTTVISFSLPYSGSARLDIFDLRGRRITTLVRGEFPAGEYSVRWSGRDDHEAAVASGTYYVRLVCAGDVKVRKLTLLK